MVLADRKRMAAFGYTAEDVIAFVRESRTRGFAYRQRGLISGTKAIAVPIGEEGDPIMAAITVSGMAKRMTIARVNEIIGEVKAVAEEMERKRSADGVRLEVPGHKRLDIRYRPALSDAGQGLG